MTFAKFVCVERAASPAGPGAYEGAFLSANNAADARAGRGGSGYRQLISVLLPETARMPMAAATRLRRGVAWQGEPQN